MKLIYGFKNENKQTVINEKQAKTVKKIFGLYLSGYSLAGIAEYLEEKRIHSPTGKGMWSRASIDKMLSNKKYLAGIISFEQYTEVQFEKDNRTNKTGNGKRKTTRYNSLNVLSGLLVCGCCGENYRRITRASGEIVWRCADKVENGRKALCHNSNTISEEEITIAITNKYGKFEPLNIKEKIDKISISKIRFDIISF